MSRLRQHCRKAGRPMRRLTAAALVLVLLSSIGMPIGVYGADPSCGLEEHRHQESCYLIPGSLEYSCTDASIGLHHHDDSCYDEEGKTVCGYSDFVIHTHDDLCCDADGQLVCTLEERELHQHDDSCYTEEKTLVCSEEEDPGHQHGDSCYVENKTLECELEESEGHAHTEDCFANCMEDHEHSAACASCGIDEADGHQHTDACYSSEKSLSCELDETEPGHIHQDSCYQMETVLSCGLEEASLHSHTAGCFDSGVYESGSLICGQAELFEHQHTDACAFYSEPVLSDEAVCGYEEHSHTDACYEKDSPETNPVEFSVSVDDGYVYLSETESYPVEDFKSANSALLTFVLSDDNDVYDVLNDELPENFSGDAELSLYLEFLSTHIQELGPLFCISFTGISLDEIICEPVTDNEGNEVGTYVVDVNGTLYIILNEDGQALDTLAFFQSYDVTVSSREEVSIVGLDKDLIGSDLIICKSASLRKDEPLYGAEFALYEDAAGRNLYQVGRPTTTMFGGLTNETTFRGLQPGTYYLVETIAPDGCIRDEQVYTITVGEDYSISTYPELETVDVNTTYSLDDTAMNSHAVVFVNGRAYSELYIQVVDAKTQEIIPGFEFTKYSDTSLSNPVQGTIVSDGSSYFGSWMIGSTYYIKETKTPQGYTPDTTLYAVTSMGGDEFASSPSGLLPTSNSFAPTSNAVESVGTVYSPRAADNIVVTVEKALTENFPAGEYEFEFQLDYYDSVNGAASPQTQIVTATVAEDGSYSIDTGALFSWMLRSGYYDDYALYFTLKELQPRDTNVMIPDYWYEGKIGLGYTTSDFSLLSDDGIAPLLMGSTNLSVYIYKCFEDGTETLVQSEYIEEWDDSLISIPLTFENDYFVPDDNVFLEVKKTLTDNFPAGTYEFPFQLEDTRTGMTRTETQTMTVTVADDGSYQVDTGSLFGWYLRDYYESENISFTLKELQPNDSQVIIPDYWYEGTIEVIPDTDDLMPLAGPSGEVDPSELSFAFYKCYSSGTRELLEEDSRMMVSYDQFGEMIDFSETFEFSFENDYLIPATMTKQVLANDQSSGTEQWGLSTTADYGDVVQFKLTGTLPSNFLSFSSFSYEFYDKSFISLVPDASSFKVTLGGKTVDPADYTLSVTNVNEQAALDANEFTLSFANLRSVFDKLGFTEVTENTVIEVTYQALYHEKSDISTYVILRPLGGENLAYIKTSGEERSHVARAHVYSFNVVVDKVDEYGEALSGALFKLQKKNVDTGVYEDYQAQTETSTSFAFDGLSAGSYRLIETTVPADYAQMDPFDFTIVCGAISSEEEDAPDVEILYDDTRSDIQMDYVYDMYSGQGVITFTAANSELDYLPASLPNTGGMGNSLFYGAGAILLFGGAILVLKKRKDSGII